MWLLKLGRGISVAALRQCRTRSWASWTVRCGLSASLTMLTACCFERLPTLKEAEEALSEALITEALRRADGNQGVAVGLLGIARQALNQRLRRRQQPERATTSAA
jgi:DNA-binding NtrC family response regulator